MPDKNRPNPGDPAPAPKNKPLGPTPKGGFGLNEAYQANPNTGAEASLGAAAAPFGPTGMGMAPTPRQTIPELPEVPNMMQAGAAPVPGSPASSPPTNFNINDLVAPTRSPLAQAARDEQMRNDNMRTQGVTGLGPGPQQKQIFENQEYKDTRRAQERSERQSIKQRMRDNAHTTN